MFTTLFREFDFAVLDSPNFKEDSVREAIILPILKELGYTFSGENQIILGKRLPHPYVYIGSKRHKVHIFPDYVLQVKGEDKWILDAKAPNQKIRSGKNVEQAYNYAIHPDVRVRLYALCNGRELVVFCVEKKEPVILFELPKIDAFWSRLHGLLSVQAFTLQPEKQEEQEQSVSIGNVVCVGIKKEVGILWSNVQNIPEHKETIRFEGKLLAEAGKHGIKSVTGYELYLLSNGRYLVYVMHNHNLGDWGEAYLAGIDTKGMPLQQLQIEFPTLVTKAGLSPVRTLEVD